MGSASRLAEPVVDRHEDELASVAASTRRRIIGPSFFTLSGGILRRDPRTSNRIDSMLTKMVGDISTTAYSPHVDKNLDYLHTCLQLDMISMAAQEFSPATDSVLEHAEHEAPSAVEEQGEQLQA